jgi:sn-glycerol 3-phosphate transport system permease protein
MVERRPVLDFITHLVLIVGIAVVAFPVYLTFVASTLTAEQVLMRR